ncbi:MAG: sensor histidine kinase [Cellulosilyticaceae bacterium]
MKRIFSVVVWAGCLSFDVWLFFAVYNEYKLIRVAEIGTIWQKIQYLIENKPLLAGVVIGLNSIMAIGLWLYGKNLGRCMEAITLLKEGSMSYQMQEKQVGIGFKQMAREINQVAVGIDIGTTEMLKSDHLKAEFITNISHDLKTPLTAIMNYIGLLKKEQEKEGHIKKQLLSLDTKTKVLKRKIEEMVAASKAITGNVQMQLHVIALEEILSQVIGEYSEKLETKGIQVIISSKEDICVWADSVSLWHVIESILDNVFQYGTPNSRLYIYQRRIDGYGVLEFKNISMERLDVTIDELKRTIITGTKKREGLGLGIMVSESLMQLQNGHLELEIDGDLFKSKLYLQESGESRGPGL